MTLGKLKSQRMHIEDIVVVVVVVIFIIVFLFLKTVHSLSLIKS